MANMAPLTAYQGSSNMKSYEGSKADKKADKRSKAKEGSAREEAFDRRAASKTVIGKAKTPRVVRSQTPFGGDDIGG